MKKFLVVIEETKTGYSAYVPSLQGCVATGKTRNEVEQNIYEAINFHLEGLKAEGLPVPDVKCESELMVFA